MSAPVKRSRVVRLCLYLALDRLGADRARRHLPPRAAAEDGRDGRGVAADDSVLGAARAAVLFQLRPGHARSGRIHDHAHEQGHGRGHGSRSRRCGRRSSKARPIAARAARLAILPPNGSCSVLASCCRLGARGQAHFELCSRLCGGDRLPVFRHRADARPESPGGSRRGGQGGHVFACRLRGWHVRLHDLSRPRLAGVCSRPTGPIG